MVDTTTVKVQRVTGELRPNLQADGGDIELLGVDNGFVKVKLKGACAGCPMSMMTIKGVSKWVALALSSSVLNQLKGILTTLKPHRLSPPSIRFSVSKAISELLISANK